MICRDCRSGERSPNLLDVTEPASGVNRKILLFTLGDLQTVERDLNLSWRTKSNMLYRIAETMLLSEVPEKDTEKFLIKKSKKCRESVCG